MPFIQYPLYNVSAPTVVAVPARRLGEYIVQTPGSAGVLTFNDCATLAQASPANQVISILYNNAQASEDIDWPLQNGLVISAVPTGMVLAVTYEIWVN
jgi:hypothetical protein